MSYTVKPRQTYQPKRMKHMLSATSHHHLAFRNEWEANFDKAYQQALALKSQGYMVEEGIQRGALMESQAKKLAEAYKKAGYEVQLIPIAKWAEEQVVFLVFKPPKEGAPPTPTRIKREPKIKEQTLTPEQVIARFVKTFQPAPTQPKTPQELLTKGYAVDGMHVTALIDYQSPCTEPLVEMAREARARQTNIALPNNSKFRSTLERLRATRGLYISFDPQKKKAVATDKLVKALRVLGDGTVKLEPYADNPIRPIYVFRDQGYAVAIAPAIDVSPESTIPIEEAMAQYESTFGSP